MSRKLRRKESNDDTSILTLKFAIIYARCTDFFRSSIVVIFLGREIEKFGKTELTGLASVRFV